MSNCQECDCELNDDEMDLCDSCWEDDESLDFCDDPSCPCNVDDDDCESYCDICGEEDCWGECEDDEDEDCDCELCVGTTEEEE